MSNLSDFLDKIWKETPGYVNIQYRTKESLWKRVMPEWPAQRTQIIDFIERENAKKSEVYVSPPLWERRPEQGEKFGSQLFKGSWVIWAEFDGNAPESWNGHGGTNGQDASDLEPAAQPGGSDEQPTPVPTIRIQSSTADRQHTYWELSEFVTDFNVIQNINRTIALEHSADISGWDITQILRPPDTTNYGYAKPGREGKTYPVFIEESNGNVYTVESFKQTKDFRPLVREKLGEIPDIREVLAKQAFSDKFWALVNSNPVKGTRSDILMEVAYFAAEARFTDEQIYAIVQDCDDRWEVYKHRTDRDKRLTDIVERARFKHPTGELTFGGLIGETQLQTIYNFEDFMAVDIKLEWLYENLLPVAGYGIIAGPNGIGKSQLGLRLADALVGGNKFLEWNCKKENAKTLFFSLEMTHPELKEFLTTMGSTILTTGGDRFFIAPIGEMIPLDRPEGRQFFENQIAKVMPDLVIVDSLSKALQGKFTEDEVVLEFNNYITKVRQKYGCAVVFIHHNRKSQDKRFKSNELDDLYGSRYLSQDASFIFMMDRGKGKGTIIINPAKTRFLKPYDGPIITLRTEQLEFLLGGIEDDNDDGLGPDIGAFADRFRTK